MLVNAQGQAVLPYFSDLRAWTETKIMKVNLKIRSCLLRALCGAASGRQEVDQVNLWFQRGRSEKQNLKVNLEIRCCFLGGLCGAASGRQEVDQVNLWFRTEK